MEQKELLVPTKLGYTMLVISMLLAISFFVGGVILGDNFMYGYATPLMTSSAAFIVYMATGAKPGALIKSVEAPTPPLTDKDRWLATVEFEHEFGLPHYDESLPYCDNSFCFPKSWEDAEVGHIADTAHMQLGLGIEDSNEIRAVRWIEYEFNQAEARERKAELEAQWEKEEEARAKDEVEYAYRNSQEYENELYLEALAGMRKYGMAWLPDDIVFETINSHEGIVRYVFKDPTGRTSWQELGAIAKAANQILTEHKVRATPSLAAQSYPDDGGPKELFDYKANSQAYQEAMNNIVDMMDNGILSPLEARQQMLIHNIMTPNEARRLGYKESE